MVPLFCENNQLTEDGRVSATGRIVTLRDMKRNVERVTSSKI